MSIRPKIILHVGCEKTGSTSIQHALGESYDALLKEGVLFPRTLGFPPHVHLTACALNEKPNHPIRTSLGLHEDGAFNQFVSRTKINLAKEIEETKPSTIIISDEHINVHLNNRSLLNSYKELCEDFGEIGTVYIYFRRQDEFRLSLFSEAVKLGYTGNFDPLHPLPTFKNIPYRFNYYQIMNNLSDVFGAEKVCPAIFDREKFKDGDVVSDFMTKVGLEKIEGFNANRRFENTSIDATVIMRLAIITRYLDRFNSPKLKENREKILAFCQTSFTGRSIVLRDEVHEEFMAQFANINDALRKKYFDSLGKDESMFPARKVKHYQPSEYYPDCTLSWFRFLLKYLTK